MTAKPTVLMFLVLTTEAVAHRGEPWPSYQADGLPDTGVVYLGEPWPSHPADRPAGTGDST